jgi:hypothetical protein
MDGGREGGREGGSEIDHDQRQGLLARARMSGHILTSAKVRASMRAQEGIGCVQCVRVCACVCVCARALSVSPLFVCLCSLSLSVSLSLSLSLARARSLSLAVGVSPGGEAPMRRMSEGSVLKHGESSVKSDLV